MFDYRILDVDIIRLTRLIRSHQDTDGSNGLLFQRLVLKSGTSGVQFQIGACGNFHPEGTKSCFNSCSGVYVHILYLLIRSQIKVPAKKTPPQQVFFLIQMNSVSRDMLTVIL